MSNGSSALALGLGVAGGAAIWFFTRDKKKPSGGKPTDPTQPAAAPTAPPPAPTSTLIVGASPPRVSGPCSLKLDKSGLTVDGERADVATAVARCKLAGSAEWALMPDAPSAIVVELGKALAAEKLPVTMKK